MLAVAIEEYEVLTGTSVPTASRPMVQARIDVIATLVWAYLGVQAAAMDSLYHNVLVYLVAMKAARAEAVPVGILSESVGSTSVSYANGFGDPLTLTPDERAVLDGLMGQSARGIRSIIVTLA